MHKKIIFIVFSSFYAVTVSHSQNVAINSDGSLPETGVVLDVKGANALLTTGAQNVFQIKSFDANGLKMRMVLGTDAVPANTYGGLEVYDAANSAYRTLALQPNGGNVGVGTTTPSSPLHIVRNSSQIPGTVVQIENTNTGTQAYAGVDVITNNAAIDMRTYGSGWNGTFTHGGFNLAQKAELWAAPYLVAGLPDALLIGITAPSPIIFCTTDAERMRLDLNGNLGLGTTNPSSLLHVYGGSATVSAPGGGYGLLFKSTSAASDKMTVSWFDNAGTEKWRLINDQDANLTDDLRFYSNNTGTNVMTMLQNGNVGIGTTAPGNTLTVFTPGSATPLGAMSIDVGSFNNLANSQASYFLRVRDVGAGNTLFYVQGDGSVGIGCTNPQYKLHVIGDIASSGTIRTTNALVTGAITACSDIRYKKDISILTNSLDKVLSLRGVNYFWKVNEFPEKNFSKENQIGFIAQEIEKIYPEIVFTDKDGYKSVDYSRLTPVLVEAIKEQQKIIDKMRADYDNRIKALEQILSTKAEK